MKKAEFIALGISEELAAKAEKASLDELKGYVEKSKHDEVLEENKTLKTQVTDRDKQLETLKASAGNNEELKQQIENIKQQNAEQEKAHKAELAKLKLDNAVEIALSSAKAKNGKAVKAMLDMEKVKMGEDGKLSGLDEQIEALKKSDGYMFDVQQAQHQFRGFQPGVSSIIPDSTVLGYENRLADARKNNNQLEVIKIKQEAAAEGVVLM